MLRMRGQSSGLIDPCLPKPASRPPAGDHWLHEIKHDGFRMLARLDSTGVRLITRHGNDFTERFPLAAEAVRALPARSALLDGEIIVTDEAGLSVFELLRRKRHGSAAVLVAFDLIELDGEDLRRRPIEERKAKLANLIRVPRAGVVLNEHYEGDGEIVFRHACKLGCEGIVSKRRGSSRAVASLAQGQEPVCPSRTARGGGRLVMSAAIVIRCLRCQHVCNMTTAEACHKKAEQWLSAAKAASNSETSASMRRVSELWAKLALQIDHTNSAENRFNSIAARPVESTQTSVSAPEMIRPSAARSGT